MFLFRQPIQYGGKAHPRNLGGGESNPTLPTAKATDSNASAVPQAGQISTFLSSRD